MNQILYNGENKRNSENYNFQNSNMQKRVKVFKIQLVFSILLTLFFLSYYIYFLYKINKSEKLSNSMISSFDISMLYTNNSDVIPIRLNSKDTVSVIGVIKIYKIGLEYPILSDINDNLLKIAPCKFYGPMPNKVGNLCIAGHNYDDNRFFSKINTLKNNDIISIYNSSR